MITEDTWTAVDKKTFTLTPEDPNRLQTLCGQLDKNLQQIEHFYQITIEHQNHRFCLLGEDGKALTEAKKSLERLYKKTEKTDVLSDKEIHLVLGSTLTVSSDKISIKTKKSTLHTRNESQRHYVKGLLTHTVNFGIGPSGTGKTFLAIACAVHALEHGDVERIILTRPIVEAGEKLGFLPGSLEEKTNPYLRPLYDALEECMEANYLQRLIQRNIIEIAPLAYMRGRTLNKAFIILDEGQNTTQEQIKMFITRLGFGSKVVITGDITQMDLPAHQTSGLSHILKIVEGISDVGITRFQTKDVVRHPLVQAILESYERFEKHKRT